MDVLLVGCDYDGPFEISIVCGHAKRCQVSDIILGKDAVGPSNPVWSAWLAEASLRLSNGLQAYELNHYSKPEEWKRNRNSLKV